jgi:hypothetical protein
LALSLYASDSVPGKDYVPEPCVTCNCKELQEGLCRGAALSDKIIIFTYYSYALGFFLTNDVTKDTAFLKFIIVQRALDFFLYPVRYDRKSNKLGM